VASFFSIFTVFTLFVMYPFWFIVPGAIILALWIAHRSSLKRKKRQVDEWYRQQEDERKQAALARGPLLIKKYGPEIGARILAGTIWQGMTAEELTDSAGPAEAIDYAVTKTKNKEVWKYGQSTATRFDMRITLENGLVVGWQKRQ
jgi:hypothetical protein